MRVPYAGGCAGQNSHLTLRGGVRGTLRRTPARAYADPARMETFDLVTSQFHDPTRRAARAYADPAHMETFDRRTHLPLRRGVRGAYADPARMETLDRMGMARQSITSPFTNKSLLPFWRVAI